MGASATPDVSLYWESAIIFQVWEFISNQEICQKKARVITVSVFKNEISRGRKFGP